MKSVYLSDRLNPMLVKELKQELRAKGFVNVFIWGQAMLVLGVLLGTSGGKSGMREFGAVLFWIGTGFPLLIALPRGGFRSFQKEIEAQTLDLLLLSQITAWKIVFGKWLAYVLQASLFAVSVMPYLVVRYFHGNVNLVADLLVLLLLWIISALVMGMAVGSAASRDSRRQLGFSIMITTMLLTGSWLTQYVYFFYSGLRPGGGVEYLVFFFVEGALWVLVMLYFGAARIAPLGENHSVLIRLIGIAAVLSIPLLKAAGMDMTADKLVMGALLVLIVAVSPYLESPRYLASIYLPFVKWGAIGRFVGIFFQPGWQSGLLYSLPLLAAVAYFWEIRLLSSGDPFVLLLCLASGLVLTRLLMNWFFLPTLRYPLRAFVAINVILFLITAVVLVAIDRIEAPLSGSGIFFFPISVFLAVLGGARLDSFPWTTFVIGLGALVLLLPAMFAHFSKTREFSRALQKELRAQ